MSAKVPSLQLYTGQEMPVIGIGTWQAKDKEIHDLLSMALECGYRHIDTAYIYMNESAIGEVLEEWFTSGRIKREDLFITTKVDAGHTKAIGLSNFNSKQIQRIMDNCRIGPANMQIEVHPYHQQSELREIARRHGMTVCAYAPLGAPYMATGTSEFPLLLEHNVVCDIAKRLQRTPAQVLSRFLIQLGLTVIPKSSKLERVKQNFQIFDFELSAADMSALGELDRKGEGRIYKFDLFKGFDAHPEFPMRIPF